MISVKKLFLQKILPILFLACFIPVLHSYLTESGSLVQLSAYSCESEEFRSMDFGEGGLSSLMEFAGQEQISPYEVAAVYMITNSFQLKEAVPLLSLSVYRESLSLLAEKKPVEFKKVAKGYETVLADLRYFPLAQDLNGTYQVNYENSWNAPRTYGGERSHEGTDLMITPSKRGRVPVVSMTDGTVEKMGWLEQGGWRIGIRAEHGLYLYYAHLESFAGDLAEGSQVKAGQIIGYAGDSGYSKTEGTTGNFDVHLHLGFYIKTDHYDEVSVNPYWILRYMENKKLKCYCKTEG